VRERDSLSGNFLSEVWGRGGGGGYGTSPPVKRGEREGLTLFLLKEKINANYRRKKGGGNQGLQGKAGIGGRGIDRKERRETVRWGWRKRVVPVTMGSKGDEANLNKVLVPEVERKGCIMGAK